MHLSAVSRLRLLAFVLLGAVFSQSAVVQEAHPIVVYSQRLPFEPATFVSGLAADHSGATYLVRGLAGPIRLPGRVSSSRVVNDIRFRSVVRSESHLRRSAGARVPRHLSRQRNGVGGLDRETRAVSS